MTGLSRRQAALLAVLLDADGAPVGYERLGRAVGSAGINDRKVLCQHVHRLRHRLGVACIEQAGCGYRLTDIPPDWALDDVLAKLDEMRRHGWEQPVWQWRRAS